MRKRNNKKNATGQTEKTAASSGASELNSPVWSLTDGKQVLGSHLVYSEAVALQQTNPKGTILTDAAAARLIAVS